MLKNIPYRTSLFMSVAGFAALAPLGTAAQTEEEHQHAFPHRTDEIIVTASPIERTVGETILNVSVIDDEELQRRLENTIGETLRREPGVSSTFFGPGAGRPIIRGLGGDRIRVLDNGIGSIDASSNSPDHAVAVDPATAERIEIVRGSGMLLYGSSAAGGVVNVLSNRIPSAVPEGGIDGSLRIGGSTVDDGVEAGGGFDLDLGKFGGGNLVFHGDGFYREAEDYEIPGFAESARQRALEEEEHDDDHDDDHDHDHEEEEEVFGVAENSRFETYGGSAGLSWVFDNGFFGVSGTAIDSLYGVPGGHEHGHEEGHEDDHDGGDEHDHEEGEEEEGGVSIDLRQRRLDFNGEIEGDFGFFSKAKFRLGYADYEHAEVEPSGEVGTLFTNQGWEGRLELVDRPRAFLGGQLTGAIGGQFRLRDFSAIGEEAFVPPTESEQYGVFALQELALGQWRFELGGRYENTSHEVQETGFTRDFDGFSVSGGVGYQPVEELFFGVTAYRTERAPSTEELFSNGPHLATNAFEIGDPTLGEEVAVGVEATARIITEHFRASINGFYTTYDDFIFETPNGEEEDGLPVFLFLAEDATFTGFEAQMDGEIARIGNFDIHGDTSVDYVRATTDASEDSNLPRIPPLSGIVGLEARSTYVDARAEFEYAIAQEDTATFELPTDGYQVFNAYLTVRPLPENTGLSIRFSGANLTDEEVRLHTSFLKDLVPLQGRNFRISLQGTF